jgi:hypothetical protein
MIIVTVDNLTLQSAQPSFTIGDKYIANGDAEYTYVKVSASSAHTCSAGRVMYATTTDNVVSDDFTGGDGFSNSFYGLGIGAIALGSYGWLLTKGEGSALKNTAAITLNDSVIAQGDGVLTTKAGTTFTAGLTAANIGTSLETVTAAATTVKIRIR